LTRRFGHMAFTLKHVRDRQQIKIFADIERFVEEKKKYYTRQDNFGAKQCIQYYKNRDYI